MAHTYANISQFGDYIRRTLEASEHASQLQVLQAASTMMDDYVSDARLLGGRGRRTQTLRGCMSWGPVYRSVTFPAADEILLGGWMAPSATVPMGYRREPRYGGPATSLVRTDATATTDVMFSGPWAWEVVTVDLGSRSPSPGMTFRDGQSLAYVESDGTLTQGAHGSATPSEPITVTATTKLVTYPAHVVQACLELAVAIDTKRFVDERATPTSAFLGDGVPQDLDVERDTAARILSRLNSFRDWGTAAVVIGL